MENQSSIDKLPLPDLTLHSYPARRVIKTWGMDLNSGTERSIREQMKREAGPFAGIDRRIASTPSTYTGKLIDSLVETVETTEREAREKAYVTPNDRGFSQADFDEFIHDQL